MEVVKEIFCLVSVAWTLSKEEEDLSHVTVGDVEPAAESLAYCIDHSQSPDQKKRILNIFVPEIAEIANKVEEKSRALIFAASQHQAKLAKLEQSN